MSATPESARRGAQLPVSLEDDSALAIVRDEESAIEIDEVSALRQPEQRGESQRGAHHAPDDYAQPELLGARDRCRRLGQPSRLVELDVHGVVAIGERLEGASVVG